MKRPIRETERARKVACASRDDEKKNHRWSRVPKCYGRWDDGSASPRVCRRFAGARDAREIATRRAGSRGARAVHRVFLEALAFHGSSADASIGGDVFSRGAGPRGIGGGGNAPHDVRVDAPGRTQHQVELRPVRLHHRDARAVTHRALSPPREAAMSRLPRRAEAKGKRLREVSASARLRNQIAGLKPTVTRRKFQRGGSRRTRREAAWCRSRRRRGAWARRFRVRQRISRPNSSSTRTRVARLSFPFSSTPRSSEDASNDDRSAHSKICRERRANARLTAPCDGILAPLLSHDPDDAKQA